MQALATETTMQAWLDEWVYGCKDHNAYIKHYIEKFGVAALNSIRARAFYSAPANYGTAFISAWDERNRERTMGVTPEELEAIMEEKGVLYE